MHFGAKCLRPSPFDDVSIVVAQICRREFLSARIEKEFVS